MMTDTPETAPVHSTLGLRHVHETPQDRDWSEGYPESWEYAEAFELDDGRTAVHVRGGVEIVDPETGVHVDVYELDDDDPAHEEADRAHEHAGGPMMNYAYPCDVDDIGDAAAKLDGLPLCVVEHDDGRTELALTGGGMDLSWEICAAYVRLGYAPPIHFASLPNMAGGPGIPTAEARRVVDALRYGLAHVAHSATYARDRLLDTLAELPTE